MTMKIKPLTDDQIQEGIEDIQRRDKARANSRCSDPSGSLPTKDEVLKAIYESGVHQENPKMLKNYLELGKTIWEPSAYAMNFARKLTENNEIAHSEQTTKG